MSELSIKKDAYYNDLHYLEIEAETDSEGKAYLTLEQADQVRALRNHVKNTGEISSFCNNSIVKADDSNLRAETPESTTETQGNVYVQPENPTEQFNVNQLMRSAFASLFDIFSGYILSLSLSLSWRSNRRKNSTLRLAD